VSRAIKGFDARSSLRRMTRLDFGAHSDSRKKDSPAATREQIAIS
jgi:hypothetical protein